MYSNKRFDIVKWSNTRTWTELWFTSVPFSIYSFIHVSFKKKQSAPVNLLTLRSAAVFPLCWVQPYGIESLYTSTKAISWGSKWNVETLHSSATRVWKSKIKCTTSTRSLSSSTLYLQVLWCCFLFQFFFMHPSHLSFHFRDVHFNVMWATSFAGCNSGKLWMLKTSTFRWLPHTWCPGSPESCLHMLFVFASIHHTGLQPLRRKKKNQNDSWPKLLPRTTEWW